METSSAESPLQAKLGRPIEALLFDLDGVLIDSYEVWFHLMNAAASAWRYPPISRPAFHAAWGQGVAADQEGFFPDHGIGEIEAYYDAHFLEHVAHLQVDPAVPEIFAALDRRSWPSAVVTNTPRELASDLVRRAGGHPQLVVGGTDVPNAKPAPDMLQLACRRLGVAPERALMIGDSRYDRDAARGAGTPFAGVGMPGDLTLDGLKDLLALL